MYEHYTDIKTTLIMFFLNKIIRMSRAKVMIDALPTRNQPDNPNHLELFWKSFSII